MINEIDTAYEIMESGDVFITKNGVRKNIVCYKNHYYPAVNIKLTNGKSKRFHVHRLIALKYLKNPENLPVVNHKNGDIEDNRVENLEWCTQSENIKHAHTKRMRKKRAKTFKSSVLVKIEKSIWYNLRLVADKKGLTKDQAFEAALAEYIKKHSDIDIEKLRGALS